MANRILLKRNTSPNRDPSINDLLVGELALNTADRKIFFKHADNSLQYIKSIYASSINELQDVDTQSTAPQAGDGLVWNVASQSWIPSPVSQPLSIESLDQLGNISLTVDTVYNMRFDVGFGVTDLGNGSVKLTNLAASFGNLDAGLPNSNYGGILPIDCGGVSR